MVKRNRGRRDDLFETLSGKNGQGKLFQARFYGGEGDDVYIIDKAIITLGHINKGSDNFLEYTQNTSLLEDAG